MRSCCLIIFIVLLIVPAIQAEVIYVPAGYPTIQAGIDAAEDGDIVRVVDGVYYGPGNVDLDFQGKAIIVESGNGPDYTAIEPQFFNRAVNFRSGEGRDSILRGFTIRQGFSTYEGAGILVGAGCSPTIADNVITGNLCLGNGGGIACRAGSMPLITGNTITGNEALDGAGISVFNGDPTITANRIESNQAQGNGGGLALQLSRVELLNNLIYFNTAEGDGGGIYTIDGRLTVRNATIHRNSAVSAGGGIRSVHSVVELRDSILSSNIAPVGQEISSGDDGLPSHLAVSFTDVRGGYANVVIAPGSTTYIGDGVIFDPPRFMHGIYGVHYLRNIAAGQTVTSPCVDAGSDDAVNVTYPGANGEVRMNQVITRSDDWPDDGVLDMGYHYTPYRRNWKTIEASIACIPAGGTLPLPMQFWVSMRNISPVSGGYRQYAAKILLRLGNGNVIGPWRQGYTNIGDEYYWDGWVQTMPYIPSLVGEVKLIMVAEDVTSPPYNMPPYPPAGTTDTSTFTITTFAP